MMRKYLGVVLGFAIALNAHANSLTVRDIKILNRALIQIDLDGVPSKGSLDIDYVRDIVQFSIQNATIYPAKILHAPEEGKGPFSKVFAYQYSPNLVRVRFSVDGDASELKGKVKWEQNGRVLSITFPEGINHQAVESEREHSLISKVLGQPSHEEVKVEKIEDPGVLERKPKVAQEIGATKKLAGAREGPSMLRSFLAMLLVVGGLGLVLLYVKKKKQVVQAKRVGDSWISHLLSGTKKQKALIEVVANHALGPKQSITVVRIRGQQFVLGVTEGNVQLITQLDSDEEVDVLDDPKIADSIGKIFGGKPTVDARQNPVKAPASDSLASSFGNLLKNSSGAGATIARNAYQNQQVVQASIPVQVNTNQKSVRDQIKQRLQGMKN